MYFTDQPIIRDFDQFVAYLEAVAPLSLTKSQGRLKAVDLLALNSKMSEPEEVTKKRPMQKDFIHLNVFFYIALGAELFFIRQEKSGPTLSIRSERLLLYKVLNADERYGFLLQSFWCYMDWEMAFDRTPVPFQIAELFRSIQKAGTQKKNAIKLPSDRPMMISKDLVQLLRTFGFLTYTLRTGAGWQNNTYVALATLTLMEEGQKILPPLFEERPLIHWRDLDPYMTTARFERIYGATGTSEELPNELIDFFAVFKEAYPDWNITKRLYPIAQETIKGELILKVLLAPKCYRVIRLSAAVSLEDLHLAIQEVFNFENDHLYAFFLNGTTRYKAGNVFSDPRGGVEEPEYPAHLMRLGEIDLYPGKEFLYLFDFGDNWLFLIQVVAIEQATKIKAPSTFKLIESKGKAPEQYSSWEE